MARLAATTEAVRMIQEIEGDLLLSKAAVIAHGVAPNDPFAHGLALSLRTRAPALYKDFRHFCQTYHPKAGTLWTWTGSDGVRVVSLFTQDPVEGHHGGTPGPASEKHVAHALKALHQFVEQEKVPSLAMPRLATGAGALDWNRVKPLIQQHLGSLQIPVYLYATYRAGVAGAER